MTLRTLLDKLPCYRIVKYNEDIKEEQMKKINTLSSRMVEVGIITTVLLTTTFLVVVSGDTMLTLLTVLLISCIVIQYIKKNRKVDTSSSSSTNQRNETLWIWEDSHLILWYQWTVYSYCNHLVHLYTTVSSAAEGHHYKVSSSSTTLMYIFHLLLTLLVYLPATVVASQNNYNTHTRHKIFIWIVILSSITPIRNNNMFTSLSKTIIRVVGSSILFGLLLLRNRPKTIIHTNSPLQKATPIQCNHNTSTAFNRREESVHNSNNASRFVAIQMDTVCEDCKKEAELNNNMISSSLDNSSSTSSLPLNSNAISKSYDDAVSRIYLSLYYIFYGDFSVAMFYFMIHASALAYRVIRARLLETNWYPLGDTNRGIPLDRYPEEPYYKPNYVSPLPQTTTTKKSPNNVFNDQLRGMTEPRNRPTSTTTGADDNNRANIKVTDTVLIQNEIANGSSKAFLLSGGYISNEESSEESEEQ